MSITRRDFLCTSAAHRRRPRRRRLPSAATRDVNCIFLMLVGGPSQLDTWDPKPDAPSDVRGPFRPIPTRIAGRAVHRAVPEDGGDDRSVRGGPVDAPHGRADPRDRPPAPADRPTCRQRPRGSALRSDPFCRPAGRRGGMPANVLAARPDRIHRREHRSRADGRRPRHHVTSRSRCPTASRTIRFAPDYGGTEFGDNCLRAARLIERGCRFVTVNMFQTVYDTITWDCHAAGGSLRSELVRLPCPRRDVRLRLHRPCSKTCVNAACSSRHLVVATGEFGRTPYLNRDGGRDHWAGVWTMLLAGGGIRGGTVIGASDRLGGEPKDTPVDPGWLADLMPEHIRGPVGQVS